MLKGVRELGSSSRDENGKQPWEIEGGPVLQSRQFSMMTSSLRIEKGSNRCGTSVASSIKKRVMGSFRSYGPKKVPVVESI